MSRINAINQSLTTFVCGVLGFVPIIGLIPALYALFCWLRLARRYRGQWNPASAYLSAGVFLAVLGVLGSILLATAIVISFC